MNEIRLNGICKSYGEKQVLRNFSAVLKPGTMTALMAPSGSGKTTLLRILMGLETPDAGTVEGLEGLRLSAVFQEDRLCEGLSCIDNIRLVNPGNSRETVLEALEAFGLGDCPDQKAGELSGGMRRRTAILRALLAPYDLLLLDEPFRGLDRELKQTVIAHTARMCRGRTVLLVTHDASELSPMGAQTLLTLEET